MDLLFLFFKLWKRFIEFLKSNWQLQSTITYYYIVYLSTWLQMTIREHVNHDTFDIIRNNPSIYVFVNLNYVINNIVFNNSGIIIYF